MHARLSASKAERWMACPPSVRVEETLPDKPAGEAAEEGTFAHSLAELILRYNNKEMGKAEFNKQLSVLKKDKYYCKEMQDYVEEYAHYVWEIVTPLRKQCPDLQMLLEQRLDFSEYVPEGFGTGDVVIIADDTLHIIDLKYGQGVAVFAEGNPQLRLYALGAYLEHSMLYDIKEVHMTIVQPRLDSITTDVLSVDALLEWAETEVKPKAALAMAGDGEMVAGGHCQFCKAKKGCKTYADYHLALEQYRHKNPDLLAPEELGDILDRAKTLQKWVEDVMDYSLDLALQGATIPGYKVVESQSRRVYRDKDKIEAALTEAGYNDIHKPKELLGITEMTKLLGKSVFNMLLQDHVVKPPGHPTLAPEADKRPIYDLGAADFAGVEVDAL